MGKKLIYLLLAVFLGGFIVLQSCNESPIVTNNYGEDPINTGNGLLPTGIERTFCGTGPGLPLRITPDDCLPNNYKLEIYAGQDIYAGWIEFTGLDGEGLHITFHFVSPEAWPWRVPKIDMHVSNINDIPSSPGHYEKTFNYDPPITSEIHTEVFPDNLINKNGSAYYDSYYIAIHLDMDIPGGINGFNQYIPTSSTLINYSVAYNSPQSYVKITFNSTNSGILFGETFEGYCADPDVQWDPNTQGENINGNIYSSYASNLSELSPWIDNIHNLDLVNWIINKYPINSTVVPKSHTPTWNTAKPTLVNGYYTWPQGEFGSSSVNTPVTWYDIQAAIWALLDNDKVYDSWRYLFPNYPPPDPPRLTPDNAWGILYEALYGTLSPYPHEGYKPGCNDKAVAILLPEDRENIQLITIQPLLSYYQIPCFDYDETANADGKCGARIIGAKNWFTYFKWQRGNCPPLLK